MDTFATVNLSQPARRSAQPRRRWLYRALRRLLDILAAGLGLLLLLPLFGVIALLIRRDSPGPVFYRGARAGKDGKPFGILKFRTMYESPASYAGPSITAAGDRRVTPFGAWLRDNKINELPQLWNVLVGEMSLVGPRPEDPDIAALWEDELRAELLAVRPGITSPATIMFREEEKQLSSQTLMEDYLKQVLPSKLRLDVLYLRRRTLLTDLDVIFLTMVTLLPRLRSANIHESYLYNGPLNRLSRRFLNWFLIDWLVVALAAAFAGLVWRLSTPLHVGWGCYALSTLALALVFSLTNWVLKLNSIAWQSARAALSVDLAFSAALSTGLLMLANAFGWLPAHLPPGLLVLIGTVAFIGFVSVRYRQRILTGIASRWLSLRHTDYAIGERVLIVGAGELGAMASWLIKHGDFARAFAMRGFVDDDPMKNGLRIDGSPVLGMTDELPAMIRQHDIGLVIFAITNIEPGQRERILRICRETGTQYFMFPRVFEMMHASLNGQAQEIVLDAAQAQSLLDEAEALLDGGDVTAARERLQALKAVLQN
jgi:lipopolysaccharide/colanic/teichoic acid biosynthesis glycosyltransferase